MGLFPDRNGSMCFRKVFERAGAVMIIETKIEKVYASEARMWRKARERFLETM